MVQGGPFLLQRAVLVGGDIGTVTSDHKQISWEKGGMVTPTIADPLSEQPR